MARQHFAVGVDIDTFAFRLLQQQFQIVQVMAGHHDERAFFNIGCDFGRHRMAVGFGVGFIQQLHANQVNLTGFKNQRKKLVNGVFLSDGLQRFIEKIIYLFILIAQHAGVMSIRSHTFQAE